MRRRGGGALGLASVALALGGCLPTPATQEARAIAELYTILMVLAAIVAVIVIGLATFMILRYRKRRDDDALPPQDHGDLRFEAVWTLIPIVTIVGLLALTVTTLQRVDAVVDGGSAQVKVDVQAFRWGWRFAYPDQGIVVEGVTPDGPELVVPVGEGVQVTLTGNDVVHSFFVPQFLFKRDAIPGRQNVFGFTVESPGTYRGQCAEFCGVGHSKMPFAVRAVPRAEFDAWLASAPRGSATP
jgi:cytochrome c oxidase subunit 2